MFIRLWRKFRHRHQLGYGISILIPFRSSKKYIRQDENFHWVLRYWRCQLPGAEIIVGRDPCKDKPFSKAVAVNNAASRATGDIFVIADVDCYIAIESVLHCAEKIREELREGRRMWYIPYRQFYRLTNPASQRVLDSDPCHPYTFSTPPPKEDIQNSLGSGRGHWFGALIQMMPSEAFWIVGGWDKRFRGWGGEDHSSMRAMDTLYWRHHTLPGQVLHLWHPMLNKDGTYDWVEWKERLWDNQEAGSVNGRLAERYSKAYGDIKRMRKLVDEGLDDDNR